MSKRKTDQQPRAREGSGVFDPGRKLAALNADAAAILLQRQVEDMDRAPAVALVMRTMKVDVRAAQTIVALAIQVKLERERIRETEDFAFKNAWLLAAPRRKRAGIVAELFNITPAQARRTAHRLGIFEKTNINSV